MADYQFRDCANNNYLFVLTGVVDVLTTGNTCFIQSPSYSGCSTLITYSGSGFTYNGAVATTITTGYGDCTDCLTGNSLCSIGKYCLSTNFSETIQYDDEYNAVGFYNGTYYFSASTSAVTSVVYYNGDKWCLSETLGGSCILFGAEPCYSECPDLCDNVFFSGGCPTTTTTTTCALDFEVIFECTPTPTPSNCQIVWETLPTSSATYGYLSTSDGIIEISASTIDLTGNTTVGGLTAKTIQCYSALTCTDITNSPPSGNVYGVNGVYGYGDNGEVDIIFDFTPAITNPLFAFWSLGSPSFPQYFQPNIPFEQYSGCSADTTACSGVPTTPITSTTTMFGTNDIRIGANEAYGTIQFSGSHTQIQIRVSNYSPVTDFIWGASCAQPGPEPTPPPPTPLPDLCSGTSIDITITAITATTSATTTTTTTIPTISFSGNVIFEMVNTLFICPSVVKKLVSCNTGEIYYTVDGLSSGTTYIESGQTFSALFNGNFDCVTYIEDVVDISPNVVISDITSIFCGCENCPPAPTPTTTTTTTDCCS